MNRIEFYFDCSSPWTYLGFESMQQLVAQRTNVEIVYKPILVGGVFNTVNPSVYENRSNPVPAKSRYYAKDLADWAQHVGVTIGSPSVFPVNSVKAMRGALVAMDANLLEPYVRAVFERYWTDLEDISRDHVMRDIVMDVGLDVADFFEKISSPHYKDALRRNTEELIERGGFGSPTFFLNGDDMFFGNDRLQLMEAKLR